MRSKIFFFFWAIAIVLSFAVGTNLLPILLNASLLFGAPHIGPFYEPFHILYWLYSLDFSNGTTSLYIALGSIAGLIFLSGIILLILYKRFKLKPKGIHGTSRWMNNAELKKSGLLTSGGIILGQSREARFKQDSKTTLWNMISAGKILFNNSPEHVLIVAPTRRGKGINNVIPTLLHWNGSCVIYDLKKENWDVTAGWRGCFSHVLRFEPTSQESVRFNPLMEIEKGIKEVPQVQNLCEILSDPFGEAKKDHWNISANQLLVGVVLHVLYSGKDKSLYGVYEFLNNPEKTITEMLTEMLETQHLGDQAHPKIAQAARNMLNRAENELSSVVSTATSYLSLYQDPIVAANTSVSDFAISDLMNGDHPVSLYLVVNPQDADRIKPLTRLVLQMIGRKLTSEGVKKRNHRLLFLIDEFPALGALEFFETQLAFFAGYGIKCVLITQSFNQLYKHYGRNTSIPDNCRVKVILGADSPDEAKILSEFLGKETMSQKTVSRSGKASSMILSGRSESHSETGRSLMTPDEVLRLPFDDIVILAGGTYPYNAKKIMYFIDPRFKPRANRPAPDSIDEQRRFLPPPMPSPWNTSTLPVPTQTVNEIITEINDDSISSPELKELNDVAELPGVKDQDAVSFNIEDDKTEEPDAPDGFKLLEETEEDSIFSHIKVSD